MNSTEFSIWKLENAKKLSEISDKIHAHLTSSGWEPRTEYALVVFAHYCDAEGRCWEMGVSLGFCPAGLSQKKINVLLETTKKKDFKIINGKLPTKFDSIILREKKGLKNLFSLGR